MEQAFGGFAAAETVDYLEGVDRPSKYPILTNEYDDIVKAIAWLEAMSYRREYFLAFEEYYVKGNDSKLETFEL